MLKNNVKFKLIVAYKCRQTSFYCTLLYCTSQISCFLQIEGLWQPNIEQVCQCNFPSSICSFCVYSSVQFSLVTQPYLTLCDPMDFLSITNSWSLLKLMSIKSEMPSNHLILCRPLLLLLSIFPSIMVFYNKSVLRIMWPKYWSFSFSISPSNEHPGLISFTTDLDDVLAVQGILKSLLKHHS